MRGDARATPLRQFVTIVLPNLRHSLFSAVMVAALSIGEFQISNLIAGFRYRNYPIVLLQAFYGASGMACAATVVLLVSPCSRRSYRSAPCNV